MLSGPPSRREHYQNGGGGLRPQLHHYFIMPSQRSHQRGNGTDQVELQLSEEGMSAEELVKLLLEKAVERLKKQCIAAELETLILLKVTKTIKANLEFALLQETKEILAK